MDISIGVIKTGTGCDDSHATTWQPYIQAACDKFEINTQRRIAAFLANVGVESNSLRTLVENLNYSAQGLANTWPSRFKGSDGKPNALANSIQRQPEPIANNVYASRLGNGDVASGDGWRYRGQGPIQLTGKANMEKCGAAIGLDLVSDPSQLQQPPAGSLSAAWFFATNGCNESADKNDFAGVVKHINGAPPNAANQGQVRTQRYNECLAAMTAGA